ncbi:MAG: CopG family transcriptional regulator [Deltaproteobacteria bacterium]|nr:CopG family transcriptional regulator [Deltaproteobacteria bacterium]
MHRTMIYIEDESHHLLSKKAKLSHRTLSELIREAIRLYIDKVVKKTSWEADPLWNLEGKGKALKKNTDSMDHDRILYGEKP